MGTMNGVREPDRSLPNSIRQKKILTIAEERPDASLDIIASEVPSATVDLVEHVLDEYGGPAPTAGNESVDEPSERNDSARPALPDLTNAQRRTLQAIHDNPEASQRELAELLDVANSTISNRVNSIEGFEWETRGSFADTFFDEMNDSDGDTDDVQSSSSNVAPTNEPVPSHFNTEDRRNGCLSMSTSDEVASALTDPELVHKVMHACLRSDVISEDEELRILKALLGTDHGRHR